MGILPRRHNMRRLGLVIVFLLMGCASSQALVDSCVGRGNPPEACVRLAADSVCREQGDLCVLKYERFVDCLEAGAGEPVCGIIATMGDPAAVNMAADRILLETQRQAPRSLPAPEWTPSPSDGLEPRTF